MQRFITLVRRELGGFFFSLTGYVTIAAAAMLIGLGFVVMIDKLHGHSTALPVTELFFGSPFFWMILLLATPVITMRLFAAEKFTGTFETLMTTPISDRQVVFAKFTAALVFYLVMWLPLLPCLYILSHYANDPTLIDPGSVAGMFLGIALLGCLYVAMGTFASSLTRSQVLAAMISLGVGVGLFFASFLGDHAFAQPGWTQKALSQISMLDQMYDLARGVVDTRHLVFYLTLTPFFLFLTLRVVESRRWK